ncbi:hypothetical protein LINGRAHAP2_LOCUS30022 [Linum grandiflorum]
MFVADDNILFFRANMDEATRIRQILDKYAAASGQLIKFEKSGLLFSKDLDTHL